VPDSVIPNLTRLEQRELLDDLNYLNTSEIKRFCVRTQFRTLSPSKLRTVGADALEKMTARA